MKFPYYWYSIQTFVYWLKDYNVWPHWNGLGKDADLSKFGNEESIILKVKETAHKHSILVEEVVFQGKTH